MVIDSRLPFSVLQLCRQCIRSTPHQTRSLTTSAPASATTLGQLGKTLSDQGSRNPFSSNTPDTELNRLNAADWASRKAPPPYHLHIYATKHNTHINLTNPEHNPVLSKSTGNIGFRKAARGTYDAAYQLTAYMLGQIYEGGLLQKIKGLEVVLRGFGVGREAVTKALLGAEGAVVREDVRRTLI